MYAAKLESNDNTGSLETRLDKYNYVLGLEQRTEHHNTFHIMLESSTSTLSRDAVIGEVVRKFPAKFLREREQKNGQYKLTFREEDL